MYEMWEPGSIATSVGIISRRMITHTLLAMVILIDI